jgi:hypothetical protein
MTDRAEDVLAFARAFHAAYEELAPTFGYTTNTETRTFDPAGASGRLMLAVCAEMYAVIAEPLQRERDAWAERASVGLAAEQERDALRALLLDVRDEADARDSEERVSLSDALRDRIGAALKTA